MVLTFHKNMSNMLSINQLLPKIRKNRSSYYSLNTCSQKIKLHTVKKTSSPQNKPQMGIKSSKIVDMCITKKKFDKTCGICYLSPPAPETLGFVCKNCQISQLLQKNAENITIQHLQTAPLQASEVPIGFCPIAGVINRYTLLVHS